MSASYFGLDQTQLIFAGGILRVFIGFAVWGLHRSTRIKKLEDSLRDFRELEPEGYEEEETTDATSEGARLKADAEAARERDLVEHGG